MREVPDQTVSAIVEAAPIGMLLVGSDGRIVFANRRCEQLFGYAREDLIGTLVEALIPERFRPRHAALRERFSAAPTPRPMGAGGLLRGARKDGREFPIEVGLSPVEIRGDQMVLASILDVSDSARVEALAQENQSLKHDASHDDLTGLPNRRFFLELSEKLISLASRRSSSVVLMYVDLDHFKEVNDRHGHEVGDRLLQEVAELLRTNVRAGDVVGRFGGDEFLISLIDTKDSEGVTGIMNKLISRISDITHIGPYPVGVRASIGAVRSSDPDSVVIDDLITAADQLMYQAKEAGGNQAMLGAYSQRGDGAPRDPKLLRRGAGNG